MKQPTELKTTFATYKIVKAIGQGGNSYVYEAMEGDQHYAIKILDKSRSTREKLKRFVNEYRFCSSQRHANIIHVIDHGLTDDTTPFFVMPLYNGSIRDLIGKIKGEKIYEVVIKILDGIDAAHKSSVIHRDIKPENILYDDSGNKIVISDFGIAQFSEDELYTAVETKDGARLANFQYAAPEQRIRGGKVDKTTDIYSLGLVINELFTGELIVGKNHKTVSEFNEAYSYFDTIIEKMLQQNQKDRYQTIDELKIDISIKSRNNISLQKLSALNKTVIPSDEIDDEIVNNPIEIKDVEWDNGILTIYLSQLPNERWKWAMNNMGGYQAVWGKGPEVFRFNSNKAIVNASGHDEAQQIINYFKEWLPRISQVYKNSLVNEAKERTQSEIRTLQKKIKEEEQKKEINSKLVF